MKTLGFTKTSCLAHIKVLSLLKELGVICDHLAFKTYEGLC